MSTPVFVAGAGRHFHLVDREQLRFRRHGRTLCAPLHLRGLAGQLPTPPANCDYSKGRAIKYPILGNNQVGNCYYAAAAHHVQTWTGNVGQQAAFDERQLVNRYLQISGGDNGLGDGQIFPEWEHGIVGPNGPHKILDEMTVNPSDPASVRLAIHLFGGVEYTAALANQWLNTGPGSTWDRAYPNPRNGHAMHVSGYGNNYQVETWGFDEPIRLTQAGLVSCDPEIIVSFSPEWFDPQTGKAPNGYTWEELRGFWVALGGKDVGPSPFAPPSPPAPPQPPTPPAPPPSPEFPEYTGKIAGNVHLPMFGECPLTATVTLSPVDVAKLRERMQDGLAKAHVACLPEHASRFAWPSLDVVVPLVEHAIDLLKKDGPLMVETVGVLVKAAADLRNKDITAILADLSAAQVNVTKLIADIRSTFNL